MDGQRGIESAHMGPITLYRFGRPGEIERLFARWLSPRRRPGKLLTRLVIRKRDVLVLFAGEIDVRVHFERHWHSYGSKDALAMELAEGGVAAITRFAKEVGASAAVASVTPPSDVSQDPEFPSNGTAAERVGFTRALNGAYRNACAAADIPFVDFSAAYADECGLLRSGASDGTVHIHRSQIGFLLAAMEASGLIQLPSVPATQAPQGDV